MQLDQAQETQNDHGLFNATQSVTAGHSGQLTRVELMPNAYGGGLGINGSFIIYNGEGTGGAVLAQQAYAIPSSATGFIPFDLDTPIPLVAGQVFTVRLTGPGGAGADVYYSLANTYAAGQGPFGGDLAFRTFMRTCP